MNLLSQIAKLPAKLESLAGLITAVVVISGVTLKITNTSNSNQAEQTSNFERMFDSIAEVKQLAEWNNIEIGFQGEQLHNINDSLIKIDAENEKQSADIESVFWAISNINNFTPEQMEEILSRELKKNSVHMTPLDLDFPSWWTQEPSTELILSNMR